MMLVLRLLIGPEVFCSIFVTMASFTIKDRKQPTNSKTSDHDEFRRLRFCYPLWVMAVAYSFKFRSTEMGDDWNGFAILATALCGIVYCYFVTSKLPRGLQRVVGVAPVLGMFLYLPWKTSNIQVRGLLSFLLIWVSSFKLLMLCFDVGPLVSAWARSSLLRFVAMAALPIKARQQQQKQEPVNSRRPRFSFCKWVTELFLMFVLVLVLSVRDKFHWVAVLILYGLFIYLYLDIFLVSLAALADRFLGADLEPQFHKPYLSRSLEDFWGRRWNLIVTNILRPSVYEPIMHLCWRIHRDFVQKQGQMKPDSEIMNKKPPFWARSTGVMATFVVSGLMHELILYYISETRITGDLMAFFVLHGFCTLIEIGLRRASLSPEMIFPRPASVVFTLLFIYVTAFWLFFPKFTKSGVDARSLASYDVLANYINKALGSWAWWVATNNQTLCVGP